MRVFATTTYLCAFGGASCKPLTIRSTAVESRWLRRPRPLPASGRSLTVRKGDSINGIRSALKASQAYTNAFGKAVSDAMAHILSNAGPDVWFPRMPAAPLPAEELPRMAKRPAQSAAKHTKKRTQSSVVLKRPARAKCKVPALR